MKINFMRRLLMKINFMKKNFNTPPVLANRLLRIFVRYGNRQSLLGDLEEHYCDLVKQRGVPAALFWYWYQTLIPFPDYVITQFKWSMYMFNNYLKIAIRNITRNKVSSFINIAGLTIGLTCCILIFLWIIDELQYNKFHDNCDSLYQVVGYRTADGNSRFQNDTPVPLAPALKDEYPEVVFFSRYRRGGRTLLTRKNNNFYQSGVYFVDPSFLKMFSFKFLKGDGNSAFDTPHSIVLTKDVAEKYFADKNPLGKTLVFNNEYELVVTGVLENVPYNSSIRFNVLLPYAFKEILDAKAGETPTWGHNSINTYIQLQEIVSVELFDKKITRLVKSKIIGSYPAEFVEKNRDAIEKQVISLSIVPLKDIRFAPSNGGSARIMYISIFSVAAFIILVTACINFTNLSTARSTKRAKEIGLRKVAGARRINLIRQFLGESLILSFFALFIAVILVITLLPVFSNMIGRPLPASVLGHGYVIPLLFTITVFTGLAGGIYPALVLSSLQPVRTVKGDYKPGGNKAVMRKVLVVIQFMASVSLMIGTLIIYKQINYVKNTNLGYDKEQVICIRLNSGSKKNTGVLKNRLMNDSRILNISGSYQHPAYVTGRTAYSDWDGKNPGINTQIGNLRVDYDYVKTMKIELLAGRDFSTEFPSDIGKSFIINEKMAKLMELNSNEAIGKRLMYSDREGIIVGVVKDFHFQPLRQEVTPAVMTLLPDMAGFLIVRISRGDISSSLSYLKSAWEEIIPEYPFEYSFLDSDYDTFYRTEERLGNIVTYFALLAVFIAAMGIFGLASYTAEQRTKEIGIRKVLGASAPGIVNLLSKEFLLLVAVSNVAAWPVSYYLVNIWLQNYAYRAGFSIWTFLLPSAAALIITLFTVSFQVYKSANANPVESLRCE